MKSITDLNGGSDAEALVGFIFSVNMNTTIDTNNNQESTNELERVRKFIDTHEWHFAKTMPQIPHWYCLLKDKNDVEEFHWFATYIREHSKPGQFYGRTYYYYYLEDYKYWWMDDSVEECDLINRDKVKET